VDRRIEIARVQAAHIHLWNSITQFNQAMALLPIETWNSGPSGTHVSRDLEAWLAHIYAALRTLQVAPSLEVAPDE